MNQEWEFDDVEVRVGDYVYRAEGSYDADWVDNGIGGYEYWGARGTHHQWEWELQNIAFTAYDEHGAEVTDDAIRRKIESYLEGHINDLLSDKDKPERDSDDYEE